MSHDDNDDRFAHEQLLSFGITRPRPEEAKSGVVAWLDLLHGGRSTSRVSLHGSHAAGWDIRFSNDQECGGTRAYPANLDAQIALMIKIVDALSQTEEWEWMGSK